MEPLALTFWFGNVIIFKKKISQFQRVGFLGNHEGKMFLKFYSIRMKIVDVIRNLVIFPFFGKLATLYSHVTKKLFSPKISFMPSKLYFYFEHAKRLLYPRLSFWPPESIWHQNRFLLENRYLTIKSIFYL